jgi:translation initiation factor SUI1
VDQHINIFDFTQDDGFLPNLIHIRLISRGRRKLTIIQDLPIDIDKKKLQSTLNKLLHCGGGVSDDNTYGQIVKLSGDHREGVRSYLISKYKITDENIKTHGV